MESSDNQIEIPELATSAERVGEDNRADESALTPTVTPSLGYVDIFGYSSAAGGWLFGGWVPRPPDTDRAEPADFIAQYERSQSKGTAILAFYQREDIDSNAIGFIAFMTDGGRDVGRLQYIAFCIDGIKHSRPDRANPRPSSMRTPRNSFAPESARRRQASTGEDQKPSTCSYDFGSGASLQSRYVPTRAQPCPSKDVP
jgi:hypothetical protein